MKVARIVLTSKTKNNILHIEVYNTFRGYQLKIVTHSGKPYHGQNLYLRSVYKNTARVFTDYTHANSFTYSTALKHAKNILENKYELI